MKAVSSNFRVGPRMAYLILSFLLLAALENVALLAQTSTNVQISGVVTQSNVHRLGVNLGDETYWDSGQMMKNLIFENPGFEGLRYRAILKCSVIVSANTCQDDNQYSGQWTGFWKGGSYEVLSGAGAGTTGTVVQSTQNPNSCSGCGQIVQLDKNINFAVGDYFAVNMYFPGTGDAGWWDDVSGGGTITTETTDISPNSPGKQAILLTAAGGKTVLINQYFESFAGLSFIQLNGNFALKFRAKGVGGNNTLNVNVERLTPGGAPYLNQLVQLTNAWQDYTIPFSANENGTAVGTVQVVFGAMSSNVELDDVDLEQTNSDPTNTTAFRDDVVNTLKQLKPGTIRMMAAGAALGSDIPNQLAVPYARYRASFSSTTTTEYAIAYGIDEFVHLCAAVGADPWITIPTATTPAEMTDLILYLTGTGADAYSASRIARGQTAPWTTVFNKIHIELGNETWNGDFKGETMAYPGYPQWANSVFGAARQTPGYQSSKFDLILDGWAGVPAYNQQMLTYSTQHDSIDIAPYLLYSANDEPQSTLFGALMAEPEMLSSPGGNVYQNMQAVATASIPTALNVYEVNLGTMIGSITEPELTSLAPSVAAGIAHTAHMLMMMRLGVQYQNTFALQQYEFNRTDQKLVRLWGIVVDMGTTDRRRPQFLTQALANSVVGGNMLTTTQSGTNPTYNQPLSSDGVQFNGVHYVQSFSFLNGNQASAVLFNMGQTFALPVTFSGEDAPVGTVQMTQITSANITDNNEFSTVVAPTTQTLSGFSASTSVSLPPFSMTLLTWTETKSQMPQFTVAAGTYSTTQSVGLFDTTAGSTIYYTTDGTTPTTSSVKYTGPISVANTQTVQAIAVASGFTTSPVASSAYIIQPIAQAPVISLASGTYTSGQTVMLTDTNSALKIYYTTDGTTPTTSSKVYTGAIAVSVNETLNAMAYAANYTMSPVVTASYIIAPPTPTPAILDPGGTYQLTQIIQITDSLSGALIYYTTDGSTPTTSSTLYNGYVSIATTATLKAIALMNGYSLSAVASTTYTIAPRVATPVLSVPGGSYPTTQTITITDATPGAQIYYTIDGPTPTTSSTLYTGPITLALTHYLQANAVVPGDSVSFTVGGTYAFTAGTPAFSVASGSYAGPQTVAISGATPGEAFNYTTDGSTPTTGSPVYTAPIVVSSTKTLKAIGTKGLYLNSIVASASYSIGSATASPFFSVASGTYYTPQQVTLTDATSGAKIYYTTDGSTPTTSSSVYSTPLVFSSTTTVKAMAAASGLQNSAISSVLYSILLPAATPTLSLASGTYLGTQTLTIGDLSSGAVIYYTTDGSTPTTASAVYAGPITISGSETVKAMASGALYSPSAVASGTYTITHTTSVFSYTAFTGSNIDWNGSANLVNGMLQLTSGGPVQAGSGWYPTAVPISSFATDFDFQLPTSTADGFTFTIQNSPRTVAAQGGNGSALGYQSIANSVAVAFDLYQSGVTGAQLLGVYTGGAAPQGNSFDLRGLAVSLHSGDPLHAHLTYDGTTLSVTMTDKTTLATVTKTFAINIPAMVGGSTAYVGFTGSTGGFTATQNIQTWSFVNVD